MKSKNVFLFLFILILAAGFKIVLLLSDAFPFNSDEAIVGLMAKHILEGERPIFFYGQSYMGSFDAWLVSAGFAFFGAKIWVIRAIQGLLYLCTIAFSMLIVDRVSDSRLAVIITGVLLAFPTVNMTLYTTVSLGGYGESLLIGSVLMLIFLILRKEIQSFGKKAILVFGMGLITGFGFWINGFTLVYSIPVLVVLFWLWVQSTHEGSEISKVLTLFLVLVVGLLVGMTPWIYSIFQLGWREAVGEIFGSAVAVGKSGYFISIVERLRNFVLFGFTVIFGIRPPWGVQLLVKALIVPVIIIWLLVIYFGSHKSCRNTNKGIRQLVAGVCLALLLGFVLTPFGNDPSGRYFLPIYHMLAIWAGLVVPSLKYKRLYKIVGMSVLVIFNIWGTFQCVKANPPGLTTQFDTVAQIDHRNDLELIHFLEENEEYFGYSNYWVAYPLAFRSDETMIFIPALPYHLDLRYTKRDNRYAPYIKVVEKSQRVAYITTKHPALDERIRAGLKQRNIQWQEEKIGDYQIFYHLSEKITPDKLELKLVE